MTTRKSTLFMAAALAGAVASSGIANAQAAAPAAPRPAAAAPTTAAPLPSGPNIAGVCVFSREAVLANSAVGKAVNTRLQQLTTQANAEVTGELTTLQNDAKTLETQRATLTTEVVQQRALTLQQREAALQRKAELRSRELDATQQKAFSRVLTEMNPLIGTVYGQKQCSVLLDRNAVFAANPNFDVTADVVRLLDAKITTFAFDRERLDQQPAAAGARPAAATPPRQ